MDGRPGNEYFQISHNISDLLTPLTPLGVHTQWFETAVWNRYEWFLLQCKNQHFLGIKYDFLKNSKTKKIFFKGHLTFLRGKILYILGQDSYTNEGLSVCEISRNGTRTKLNNKVSYKLQPTRYVGCLNKVQGLNQKESRLRGRCIAKKGTNSWTFFVPFIRLLS